MSGVELGLAIVATVDLCFKWGNRLIELCGSIRNAETEIAECILRIESYWKRTRLQLDFLQRVWNNLDAEYQLIQDRILHVLNGKLSVAVSQIESLFVRDDGPRTSVWDQRQSFPGVRRFRYAGVKERLHKTIEDLETWQKTFDPSWFMILMASNSQIDAELNQRDDDVVSPLWSSTKTIRNTLRGNSIHEKSVFLSDSALKSGFISDIPFSSLKTLQRMGSSKLLVLDTVRCPVQASTQHLTTDVRELARKLSQADPMRFGLLECYGVVKNTEMQNSRPVSFTFIFRTVEGLSSPRSLRASLMSGQNDHSLSDRLNIARDLAKSVSFVHTFGFVHKNIRPENILLAAENRTSLGHSFLLGFDQFRTAEGHTLLAGDIAWENNLYRHPRRQGLQLNDYYVMQHDIYSLGVCLLEIGLWESFTSYNDTGRCVPSSLLNPLVSASTMWGPEQGKNLLVSLANTVLPQRMGTRYADVVETCLTCLDHGNVGFGDEKEFCDEDGVLVGVRYIEKVLLQLDGVSI